MVQAPLPLRPYNLTDPMVMETLMVQKDAVRFTANSHARITMQTIGHQFRNEVTAPAAEIYTLLGHRVTTQVPGRAHPELISVRSTKGYG